MLSKRVWNLLDSGDGKGDRLFAVTLYFISLAKSYCPNILLHLYIMNGRMTQGRVAENIALEWLQQEEGMELRERNWRSEHKEIDLIMESDDFLHIVEVK